MSLNFDETLCRLLNKPIRPKSVYSTCLSRKRMFGMIDSDLELAISPGIPSQNRAACVHGSMVPLEAPEMKNVNKPATNIEIKCVHTDDGKKTTQTHTLSSRKRARKQLIRSPARKKTKKSIPKSKKSSHGAKTNPVQESGFSPTSSDSLLLNVCKPTRTLSTTA
eukprot:259202_1